MEVSSQFHASAALLPRKNIVPTEQEAGWVQKPVWAVWRREQSLAAAKSGGDVMKMRRQQSCYWQLAVLLVHAPSD